MLFWSTLSVTAQSDPHEVIRLAIARANTVKSAAYTIENTERIGRELLTGTQQVRYQQQPLQVCMTFIAPDRGATVIFDEKSRPDKLTYDPVGFPFMKLDLDPLGTIARNSNHHTIYEVGFEHLSRLMSLIYESHDAIEMLDSNDQEERYKITVTSKNRGTREYKVSAQESTRSIAQKLEISEYRIVELNDEVKGYGELKAGLTITVPDNYAHELTLEIDKSTLLPIKLVLEDELGLLASYTISNIELDVPVVNPQMKKPKYFSSDQ